MADSVANSPISNSYVGLLRISNDATGATSTPVQVYTSDGAPTALSLGNSSATINGSLTADNIKVTNTLTTDELVVTDGTIFENTITFSKASSDEPGVINEAGVIFENKGTFKSTGTINSEGTANFNTLACTEDISVGRSFTITDIASFDSNQITFDKNFNCTQTASFANVKLDNISVASGTGITINSPTSFTGTLTTTNDTTLGGLFFTINALSTTFRNAVTFDKTVTLGSNARATTQAANNNSTKVATTAYVDRATANSGSFPNYSAAYQIGHNGSLSFTAPSNGFIFLNISAGGTSSGYIGNLPWSCAWGVKYIDSHHISFLLKKGTTFVGQSVHGSVWFVPCY